MLLVCARTDHGTDVGADGGVYLSTPVDPLFVVLPLLEKSRRRVSGSMCSLDKDTLPT